MTTFSPGMRNTSFRRGRLVNKLQKITVNERIVRRHKRREEMVVTQYPNPHQDQS